MQELLYHIENLSKIIRTENEELEILNNINLKIFSGQSIALTGASGSGKSTLLHIMGTIDKPSDGKLFFLNKDLTKFDEKEKAEFRNKELGFIFQFHHLLPEFTTVENVAMQALISNMPYKEAIDRAKNLLVKVGLEHRLNHKANTLSGGERQRAAIARAILLEPKVLLADEPTGSLDEKSGSNVIDLLLNLNCDNNIALVIVTHNQKIANMMGQSLELRTGELYDF